MNDIKFRILLQSNKTGSLKSMPSINGKEVDLDLLYQIVTSHGGWEKVNARNEWDDLLEHFNLPRGLNGGLLIKHIYLKYLENYEKVFFLGEDATNKDEAEDDYDDIRSRRRTANKFTSGTRSQQQTPSIQSSSQSHPVPLSDAVREQMGLAKPTSSLDYERLLLSLQSPLPNDQDLAISVCTLLSNETKHVLKFSKCPAILNMLLAHAGIYEHCGVRMLIEETYKDARGLCLSEFWDDILYHKETMPLLCESYVRKIQSSLGLTEDDVSSAVDLEEQDPDLSLDKEVELLSEKLPDSIEDSPVETPSPAILNISSDLISAAPSFEASLVPGCESSTTVPSSDTTSIVQNSDIADESMVIDEEEVPKAPINVPVPDTDENEVLPEPPPVRCSSPYALLPSVKVSESHSPFNFEAIGCCLNCPCHKSRTDTPFANEESGQESNTDDITSYPFHMRRSTFSEDKVGQRVQQISHILRNLSFESDNASIMGNNSTLLRYLLITANCSWGSLPQMSFDLLGNIAPFVKLEDPTKDPLSSMLLSLVSTGMFSSDRFKVLRSLEILRELTKIPRNEKIIVTYMESKVYRRMCELLTICDIMLLICTLECVLAMTGLGEAVCNELVRVKGSVSTLVSLVTVEAQSYGPKGCILMRVVETVSGGSSQGVVHQQPTAQPQSSTSIMTPLTTASPQSSPTIASVVTQNIASPVSVNPAVVLRTVTGQTVVPPPSQSMQHQLAQPISNVYSPPSANTVITVAAPNVLNRNSSLQQQHLGAVLRPSTPSSAASTACIKVVNVNNTVPVRVQQPQQNISRPSDTPNRNPQAIVQGHGKPGLPNVMVNHVNSLPSENTSTASTVNNVNHIIVGSNNMISGVGATSTTTNSGGLAQVSSQSLTQQLYTPSTNLVTPPKEAEGGEEEWLTSWLRTGFESGTATSIEQEKCYLMYCGIRNDKSAVLSMDKFLQIVKNVFGASVGPVMKTFGGVSLQFLNGISPKITQAPQGVSTQPLGISVPVVEVPNTSGVGALQQDVLHSDVMFVPVSNGVPLANHQPNSPSTVAPVRPLTPNQSSVHIPSPMSPILKATLSRPPTPKSPPDEKRGKYTKSKDKRQSMSDKKQLVAKKKLNKINPPLQTFRKQQAQTKVLSPSSSAIRSLLASKVAQRQQNKLQQQETKSPKSKANSVGLGTADKGKKSPKGKHKKMNGAVNSPSDKEESSASSSLNSSEDSESKNDHSSLSFQGVLSNGVASDESLQAAPDSVDDSVTNSNVKGMLVDLLERKVPPKDIVNVNGIVGREIRISERGLELIEKDDSNSATGTSLFNNSVGLTESQEPQQMTFYASTPEVEQQVQTTVDPVPDPNQQILYASEESRGSNDSSQFGVTKTPATHNNQVKKQNSVEDQGLIVDSGAAGGGLFFDGNGSSSAVTGDVMINNNSNYVGGGGSNNNVGAANIAAGDLLEKFNQFSDLIVVNPEQLGIKRPSTNEDGEADGLNDQCPPPAKKPAIAVNGNDSVPVTSSALGFPVITTFTIHPSNSPAISTAAPSQVALVSSPSPVLQTALSSTATTTSQKIITEYPLNVVPNQIMQLPIKLTLDNRTSQNLLQFAGGKLVMRSGGTPLLFAPGQLPSNPVIYSKNSSPNEIPKIYLVQPNQNSQSGLPQQMTMAVVHESPNHPPGSGPGVVNLASLVPRPDGVPPNSYSHVPPEEIENEIPFLCEWAGCGYRFSKPQFVFMHCVKYHIPDSLEASLPCKWGTGCDPLARKRFCLMTHLQDRHCNAKMLEHANFRRKNNLEAPPLPQHPPNHPMYAPNAAYHAIKRHALQYANPKDLLDENEGPVTKSIRLTSALILRNLVNYSTLGRRIVGSYESHLSTVAMSNVESSRTIAQLLHDMSEDRHQPSHTSS